MMAPTNQKIISGKVNTGSQFFSSIQRPIAEPIAQIDMPQSFLLSPMRKKNMGETIFNSAMRQKTIQAQKERTESGEIISPSSVEVT